MTPTWYDPIATLGFLAAHTSRVRLLTSVYIPAYRHPLVSAKSFVTLDHLSGGRVIAGVGAGHVASEFAALGIDFATRGARLDESIDAMRAAFDAEYSSFSGRFFAYGEVGISPRPAQGHLPIWIGGSGEPALRRVAERGDGWIPQGTPRSRMRECVDTIRRHADVVRPGAELDLGFMSEWIYVGTPSWDLGGFKLTGTSEQIAESLREANDFGCNVLHLHFRSRSREELCDQLAAFGRDVAPLLSG
jgi:probable F420-dependent oxidoreductase